MTEATSAQAASSMVSVYDALRIWAKANGATREMLASIDKAATGAEAFSEVTLAAIILAGIQGVIAEAGEHEAAAHHRQLDAAVRAAEAAVKAAESEIPGLQETVDKCADAERVAHDDASEAVTYLHQCEDALAHARDRKVAAAEEAAAMERLRDAETVASRRQAVYDVAMASTRAARRALREDGDANLTKAKDSLEDARALVADPPEAPRSMWTLGLLGPWMLLWGPPLNDEEKAATQEVVLAMASLCGADRIIANRERARIEAERRTVSDRAVQSLSKRGARVQPPRGNTDGSVFSRA